MRVEIAVLVAGLLSYLIGSIPTGYLVIRGLKGTDIRQVGSGRTGGTNAMRAGGLVAGVLTGVGDLLKGVAAISLAHAISGAPEAEVLAGIAVVAGHNFSVFLRFKGGAGTGPNIGVCVAMWPVSALWLVPLVPIGLFTLGYASLTSLAIALVIPVSLAVRASTGQGPWHQVLYGIGTAILIGWSLRPNLARLRAGDERRVPGAINLFGHGSGGKDRH